MKRTILTNLLWAGLISLAFALHAASVRAQSPLDGFDPNANGTVKTIVVQMDGKIIIGGDFTSVAPNGGAAVVRNRIARFNPGGTLDLGFDPNADGTVLTLAVQADGKVLAGGAFLGIGGLPRNRLARLNATNGAADAPFDPNADGAVSAIALQMDGKILVGGDFTGIGGQARNRLARIDPTNGQADSFNPSANGIVSALAVQADGKILAGGFFNGANSIGGQLRNRIARLNNDGTVDSFDPNADSAVLTIALQADGKILAGGDFTGIGGQPRNRLARLNADGTADSSFNPNSDNQINSIAVQADGKILVAGDFSGIGGQPRNRLARLDATTGQADSFNPNANNRVLVVAVQPDGKILAGGAFSGSTGIGGQTSNFIARLETLGSLDRTLDLGISGLRITAIAVQPDGKIIIVGGFDHVLGQPRNRIARLNEDLTLDTAFNPNANNGVFALALQADGKILVAGAFTNVGGQTRNNIARLDPTTGAADSFNPNPNNSNSVVSIAVQTDGKILVGGFFTTIGGQTRNRLARLNADGTADSFNPNPDSQVNAIAVQADGKILVCGFFITIGGQTRRRVARLDANTGAADSFNPNADNSVNTIAVQADGKVLVGFNTQINIGGQTRFGIARLNGTTGLADSWNPTANNVVYSIVAQADGKILVGGGFFNIGGQPRNGFARLDGTTGLADSFNPNTAGVRSIALQKDGKILVGGDFTAVGGQPRNIFARLPNDTAALPNLVVTQTNVSLTLNGSAPQFNRVVFEQSTDGVNYAVLGNGTGVFAPTAANWMLTGLNLPTSQNIYIRARGFYRTGQPGAELTQEIVRNAFLAGPTVSPSNLYYGDVLTGATAVQQVTVANPGSLDFAYSLALNGTDAGEFSLNGFTPALLPPGQSVNINVAFSPASVGNKSAQLIVTANNSGLPIGQVNLSGYGSLPPPEIDVSPASITFADLTVGATETAAVTIANSGGSDLLYSLALGGANADEFSLGGFAPTPLPAGQSVSFNVTFAPTGAGNKTAYLTVASNDADETELLVNLAGNARINDVTTTLVICSPNSLVYTGSALTPCTVSVTGDNLSLTFDADYTDNVNVGTATASFTYPGDANHTGSSGSATFVINQAGSTTFVTCPANVTYTGAAVTPCTAIVTGAGGLNLTPAPAYADNVNAGTASSSYTFAGDTNHTGSSHSQTFTIGKAATMTTVTCPVSAIYTGAAVTPCTAIVTGADGFTQLLPITYADNVNVGTATASSSYPGDLNHYGSGGSSGFEIGKADVTVAVSVNNVLFDGDPHGGTAAATGVNSLNEALTITYSGRNLTTYGPTAEAPANAGDYTASATYTATDNYNEASNAADFTIGKAGSATTVTCPAGPFVYSGSASTPCSPGVTGAGNLTGILTVAYTNNVNAGTATATATFAGDDNHFGSSDSQQFTIGKADQAITFGAINAATFGAAAFGINAATTSGQTVSLTVTSGTCALSSPTSPANVQITGAGSCSIVASQGGNDNYNAAADVSRTFSIAKAAQVISFGVLPNQVFGNADFVVAATGGGSANPVTFTATGNCAISGNSLHITGAGACTVTAAQLGNSNYDPAADVSRGFSIAKAASAITVTAPAAMPFYTNVTVSGVLTGVANAPLGGQTVTFTIGSGLTAQSCSATTGATGAASCTIIGVNQPLGPGLVVGADFGGNSNYLPSSAAATTTPSLQATKQSVIASLVPFAGNREVAEAIRHINHSLDATLWVDGFHLTERGKRVFAEEKKAVKELLKVRPATAVITNAIKALTADDAALARTAITEVNCAGNSQCLQDLVRANSSMNDGAADVTRGKYDKAIQDYLKAWKYAMRAGNRNAGGDDDDDDDCEGHHGIP